jgi:hypothetical protein
LQSGFNILNINFFKGNKKKSRKTHIIVRFCVKRVIVLSVVCLCVLVYNKRAQGGGRSGKLRKQNEDRGENMEMKTALKIKVLAKRAKRARGWLTNKDK